MSDSAGIFFLLYATAVLASRFPSDGSRTSGMTGRSPNGAQVLVQVVIDARLDRRPTTKGPAFFSLVAAQAPIC
jgi:hypothetical protein